MKVDIKHGKLSMKAETPRDRQVLTEITAKVMMQKASMVWCGGEFSGVHAVSIALSLKDPESGEAVKLRAPNGLSKITMHDL